MEYETKFSKLSSKGINKQNSPRNEQDDERKGVAY